MIARLIAAIILFWALLPNPYGFYMLVRLVVGRRLTYKELTGKEIAPPT